MAAGMRSMAQFGAALGSFATTITPSMTTWTREIIKTVIVPAAKVNHGRQAHALKRFESQSGSLVASIKVGRVTSRAGGVSGLIEATGHPNRAYAAFVEYGTRVNRAYPFIRPAAIQAEPKLQFALRVGMNEAAVKAGLK